MATFQDNSKKSVSVKWQTNKVNTAQLGKQTFQGDVLNYAKKVSLTVNVIAVPKKPFAKTGKSEIYESTIKNISEKEGILQANDASLYIYVQRSAIQKSSNVYVSGSESKRNDEMMDGYKGGITFKKGVTEWDGQPVRYNLDFYNKGQLVKKMRYLVEIYKMNESGGYELIMPADSFDEIRVSAAVVNEAQLAEEYGSISVETKTVSDLAYIQEELMRYGNVSGYYFENFDKIPFYYQDHEVFAKFNLTNNEITFYPDGSNFRSYRTIHSIKEVPKNIPIRLIIQGDTSGLTLHREGTELKSVTVRLQEPQMAERGWAYLFYDQDFNLAKVIFIKP